MDSNLRPVILNETTNEIRHQYLSAAKARQQLDWHPLFTLEDGLQQTIAWYQQFFKETD
jgi:CDP-glucose 4,6-dehydratase